VLGGCAGLPDCIAEQRRQRPRRAAAPHLTCRGRIRCAQTQINKEILRNWNLPGGFKSMLLASTGSSCALFRPEVDSEGHFGWVHSHVSLQLHQFQIFFADLKPCCGPPLVDSLLRAASEGTSAVRAEAFSALEALAHGCSALLSAFWGPLAAAVHDSLYEGTESGVQASLHVLPQVIKAESV
jgi:hypothetical protein